MGATLTVSIVAASLLALTVFNSGVARTMATGPDELLAATADCQASLPASWQSAVASAPTATIAADPDYPSPAPGFALTGDGKDYFATEYSDKWSGITEIDATTERTRKLYKFPSGGSDQVLSSGMEGSWLVFLEWNLDGREQLLAWDASTGSTQTIAATPALDAEGQITFALDPDSNSDDVAWSLAAGSPKGGPQTPESLHLLSLTSGNQHLVHSGPVGNIFFWHNQLDYSIASSDDAPSSVDHLHLHAVSSTSGQQVAVAQLLSQAGLGRASSVWDFPQGIAWQEGRAIGESSGTVWILGRDARHPELVLPGSQLGPPSSVFWADGYFFWNYLATLPDSGIPSIPSTMIVVLGSGSSFKLPDSGDEAVAQGSSLIYSWVDQFPPTKTAAVWNNVVLHLNQLARLPGC